MKLLPTLALAALLTAGAATAQSTAFDPSAATFTGWVKVSNGEFQLYGQQRQLAEPFSRPCVSGALPRDLQRSARDLSGTKVTLTGRAVPWDSRGSAQVLQHRGSRIVNDCRSEFVIEADSVRVDRAG